MKRFAALFFLLADLTQPSIGLAVEDQRAKFSELEALYTAKGGLRTDVYPTDARFTAADLVRNFKEIALRIEYGFDGSPRAEDASYLPVRRWSGPVRYRLQGDGVTDEYIADYAAYAQMLSSLTALTIEAVEEDANLDIVIVGPELRKAIGDQFETQLPPDHNLVRWARGGNSPCVGNLSVSHEYEIYKGTILIKAEIEGAFREACIQEELPQALGLMNDYRAARPSIFNDNQEFVRLTSHDHFLLRALYDERVEPGMTVEELEPILPQVFADIISGRWPARPAPNPDWRGSTGP